MTASFDDFVQRQPEQTTRSQTQARVATYVVQTDKKGGYYHHPQQGRVKVIALYCDCGRSVLVPPAEVKAAAIICGDCQTAFSWQQLTFTTD